MFISSFVSYQYFTLNGTIKYKCCKLGSHPKTFCNDSTTSFNVRPKGLIKVNLNAYEQIKKFKRAIELVIMSNTVMYPK